MKKTNLTFLKKTALKLSLFVCFSLLAFVQNTYSQDCTIACNSLTNLSVDPLTCTVDVTVDMVADTSGCEGGDFEVRIFDNGVQVPNPIQGSDYIGQTLTVEVHDLITGNYAWGNITIEDYTPPTIDCSMVTDVPCYLEADNLPTANDACDGDLVPVETFSSVLENNCNVGLPDSVLRRVTKRYKAYDNSGNESVECEVVYDVLRLDDLGADITFPESLLNSNNTNLSCEVGSFPLDDQGHPKPDGPGGTGVPVIEYTNADGDLDSILLYPDPLSTCNLIVTYDDTPLPAIGCTQKIMRMWNVFEWSCSNPQRDTSILQMIEITDDLGPAITCPADMTVTTNTTSCEASLLLPPAVVSDNCSSVNVTINYPGGTIANNGGLAQMDLGENIVTYIAYDECLNSTECTMTVTVVDDTPPVTVCIQNTVVSLSSDGCAIINASVFDDGSYDGCTNVTLAVRRMDNGNDNCEAMCFDEDDEFFDNQVLFCCDDTGGDDVTVVLRATDANGNHNFCMVQVKVEDKLAPQIVCPAPITVDCDFAYNPNDHDAAFGEPIISNNCGDVDVSSVIDDSNLTSCNVGYLIRTITASDDDGSSACTQIITYDALPPFNGGVPDSAPDTDIDWPDDHTVDTCAMVTGSAFNPANLPIGKQFPILDEGACDLVGPSYEDQVFPFNNQEGDACFKIVRKWTVIDWCQYTLLSNGQKIYKEWTHTQIIKVNDPEGPYNLATTGDTYNCTYDVACEEGSFSVSASGEDDCTDVMDYTYTIFEDADNDGKFDEVVVLNNVTQIINGTGNSVTVNRNVPIGEYVIEFTFKDNCGNLSTIYHEVEVVNCKAPTPYLLNGLAVDLGDDGNSLGEVVLWATDFDNGSSHSCGYQTYVSFDPVYWGPSGAAIKQPGDTGVVVNNGQLFNCDNLGDQEVTIYAAAVTPNDSIVQAFATTIVNIQDNQGLCDSPFDRVAIEGSIMTTKNDELENAAVSLVGSEMDDEMTSAEGTYAFPLMPLGGNYLVAPEKNDDYNNGVSTLDLVMIQRHILDLEAFDSPYKHIAADINNDEDLSASDLLQLRKLILGTISEFPNNGSWNFVDADFVFDDPNDPFATAIPEDYKIQDLNSDMAIDFVAVKVGDVSEDATANLKAENNASSRSTNTVEISTEELAFNNGDVITVPVKVDEAKNITGFQFTISTDASLEFAGISSTAVQLSDYNVGFASMAKGIITVSWNDALGKEFSAGDELFELVFEAKSAGTLSTAMTIGSEKVQAEIYDDNLEVFAFDYSVNGRDIEEVKAFELYQNTPNPFGASTVVGFDLPNAEQGTFTVFDMTGKVLVRINRQFTKGYNEVTIERTQLGASGVMYYQLEAGKYSGSKKMVMID